MILTTFGQIPIMYVERVAKKIEEIIKNIKMTHGSENTSTFILNNR